MKFLSLIVAVSILFCFGCGEGEPEPVADTPPVDVPEDPPVEIDIYAEAPLLQVGFVKQDHHSAVFVSALRSEEMKDLYPVYLEPLGETYYALIAYDEKVAEVEIIQSQGAINVPNNMVAGLFEVSFGGVAAFAASADQGSGIKIVSPIHGRGDMLVVAADNEVATDWDSFVEWVNTSEEPIVVGYKAPTAVALIVFESALAEAGIPFSYEGNPVEGSKVLLYNANGQPNLNPALQGGTIDAYVSNNPACALAEANGVGNCIAELASLPPGDFADHPCCAVAATSTVIEEKPEEVAALLELFAYATDYINENPEDAAAVAAEWIGNTHEVEMASMATSFYSVKVTDEFYDDMNAILDNMRELDKFTGPLAVADPESNAEFLYDFSLLPDHTH